MKQRNWLKVKKKTNKYINITFKTSIKRNNIISNKVKYNDKIYKSVIYKLKGNNDEKFRKDEHEEILKSALIENRMEFAS